MTAEGVIAAFIDPLVERALNGGQGWKNWLALVAQVNTMPAWGGEIMHRFFDPVVHQLVDTLGRAMPGSKMPDLYWCYQFLTGSMTLTVAETGRIDQLSDGLCHSSDLEAARQRLYTYCAAGFVTELREQLAVVYNRQFRLTWNEYVGTNVPGRDLDVRERRALIALTLFDHEPTGKDQITSLIAELARKYARTGVKTLARDLQELVQTGLLVESQGMYRAKTEVLLSLLPMAVPE